jgi:hypothetical protein
MEKMEGFLSNTCTITSAGMEWTDLSGTYGKARFL